MQDNEKTTFDYVIITVSSSYQETILRKEINQRKKENIIPSNIKYITIVENEKIGSGGAILNVIKFFYGDKSFFKNNKILLINSAGDSKRLILYADKGKVCVPTFKKITRNITSIVFDEIMLETKPIAKKMDAGMLVVSGDCTTIYKKIPNIKIKNNTAISVKANVEFGERHGVFIQENGELKETLQKRSIKELINKKAVDNEKKVNIDTGMFYINPETIGNIRKIISTNDEIDEIKFKKIANNNVILNFYTDFVYPLSKNASREQFLRQKGENKINKETIEARKKIWEALKDKKLEILEIEDGKFIHYGTVSEFIDHAFSTTKTQNIIINSKISKNTKMMGRNYIENSELKGKNNIGKNSIIMDSIISNCNIPNNTIIKTVKKQGKFVTIILNVCDDVRKIWEKKIFTKYDNKEGATKLALAEYQNSKESEEKLSLKEIFEET